VLVLIEGEVADVVASVLDTGPVAADEEEPLLGFAGFDTEAGDEVAVVDELDVALVVDALPPYAQHGHAARGWLDQAQCDNGNDNGKENGMSNSGWGSGSKNGSKGSAREFCTAIWLL